MATKAPSTIEPTRKARNPGEDVNDGAAMEPSAASGTTTDDEEEKATTDDEGLLKSYDVILCGTGLVQSILASALARAGRSVLHVDGNDYYGGLEAAWTLPYLLARKNDKNNFQAAANHQLHREFRTDTLDDTAVDTELNDNTVLALHKEGSNHSLRFHTMQRHYYPVTQNSSVQTAYGPGRVERLEPRGDDGYYRLVIELTRASKLSDGAHPKLYVGVPVSKISTKQDDDNNNGTSTNILIDEHYLYQHHKIRTIQAEIAARVLNETQLTRSFALDVTPYLLFCTGPAVAGLLASGVADYCEFKSLEGLLYMDGTSTQKQQQQQQQQSVPTLSRVPCSKNDVFASKLLSPMDKRRLMKFLQTAMDYATAEKLKEEADAIEAAATEAPTAELQSWNERHLNQGRSLQRPQNKSVANTDLQHLQKLCRRRDVGDNDGAGDSPQLSFETYLRHDQKLSPSLTALVRHALALETGSSSSGETSVADGMKQLCSHMLALGRYGGTAFLVPMYGSGEIPQAFCRSAAVFGATYLLRRAPTAIVMNSIENSNSRRVVGIVLHGPPLEEPPNESDSEAGSNTKHIQCRHVVVPDGALQQQTKTGQRVLRRTSILSGKPLLTEDFQPQQQRHLMILPPNSVGSNRHTIHGLLLDEGVHVVPHVLGGCSVLHLTTTVDAADANDDHALDDAVKAILENSRLQYEKCDSETAFMVDEIFHVTFSYDVCAANDDPESRTASQDGDRGLHVIHRPCPGVAADAAFEQAASIFAKICPNQEFLKMSQAVDDKVKETLGEVAEEDEEKLVLESAVGMIAQTQASSQDQPS